MTPEQELWERVFIAALTGVATSNSSWKRVNGNACSKIILNRACRTADEAVKRVMARREKSK